MSTYQPSITKPPIKTWRNKNNSFLNLAELISTYRCRNISPVGCSLFIHPLHGLELIPRKIIVEIYLTFIKLRFKFHYYHRKQAYNVTHFTLYPNGSWMLNGHETNNHKPNLIMLLTFMLVIQFTFFAWKHILLLLDITSTVVDAMWQNEMNDMTTDVNQKSFASKY